LKGTFLLPVKFKMAPDTEDFEVVQIVVSPLEILVVNPQQR
jgi:hypothetical protein